MQGAIYDSNSTDYYIENDAKYFTESFMSSAYLSYMDQYYATNQEIWELENKLNAMYKQRDEILMGIRGNTVIYGKFIGFYNVLLETCNILSAFMGRGLSQADQATFDFYYEFYVLKKAEFRIFLHMWLGSCPCVPYSEYKPWREMMDILRGICMECGDMEASPRIFEYRVLELLDEQFTKYATWDN